jgi:predicted Rossmann fold flavoprotein
MMAAIECGKRGRRVAILERSGKIGEKIRISGGGKCNFTNTYTKPSNFISENPSFCISALKRFTPSHFINLLEKHNIDYHERKHSQLFCDKSAVQIIKMLQSECHAVNVDFLLNIHISKIEKLARYRVFTQSKVYESQSVIIATGGKSIPKIGATSFGYDVAKKFGLQVVEPKPALVPLTFNGATGDQFKGLAGIAVDVRIKCAETQFEEALLFTHRGLSGPAVLQISSYWSLGQQIIIDLLPDIDFFVALKTAKDKSPKQRVRPFLEEFLPNRLASAIASDINLPNQFANTPVKQLRRLNDYVNRWQLIPSGDEGYRTAEVTRGGVSTTDLSSKTMEALYVPGLYFIGEVVDVTGHLGGFNFQWAWSSGYVAGQFA